ncbi:MAG: rRNA maturation RNase YbeY, partial [Vicinamibacterales bacterium]
MSDGRGRAVGAPGLAAWLARVAPARARGDVAIALVTDTRIRALNRTYRKKDAPTDVLSFEPADIVIATGVARRQAHAMGHSYATELKVLALHGLLHLLG